MFLGGCGMGPHFISFAGLYHGFLLPFPTRPQELRSRKQRHKTILRQIWCFHFDVFGWLLFESKTLNNFLEFIQGWGRLTVGQRIERCIFLLYWDWV